MIYFVISISIVCFFIGYVIGSEQGYRKAHHRFVTSQSAHTITPSTPRAKKSGPSVFSGRKLHLVKKEDKDNV